MIAPEFRAAVDAAIRGVDARLSAAARRAALEELLADPGFAVGFLSEVVHQMLNDVDRRKGRPAGTGADLLRQLSLSVAPDHPFPVGDFTGNGITVLIGLAGAERLTRMFGADAEQPRPGAQLNAAGLTGPPGPLGQAVADAALDDAERASGAHTRRAGPGGPSTQAGNITQPGSKPAGQTLDDSTTGSPRGDRLGGGGRG